MVSSVLVDALSDPTRSLQDLYHANPNVPNFPAQVAAHFSNIFASKHAFSEIPSIHAIDPTKDDRRLVQLRAMIQDTSFSPEMYIATRSGARCGGWGLHDDVNSDLEHESTRLDLQENTVFWAVSVPGESDWVASEIDGPNGARLTTPPIVPQSYGAHKFPVPGAPHLGVQVKVYDTALGESLKSTDVVTLVGILTMETMSLELESPNADLVPTLHVLFMRPLPLTVVPRSFPYSPTETTVEALRGELIAWIAAEGLAGDTHAAEWVLLSIIARSQSRSPPLLPPSLTISKFPPPAGQWRTPKLSVVLAHLLPIVDTLALSLDVLNASAFSPESKNEDLHSGRLQLPRGSVCVVTEGGITEGGVSERGIMNLRALQEVIDNQTLNYQFPFSSFPFQTDIAFLVLSEGRQSAFFQTHTNVPLELSTPDGLYGPPEKTALPAPAKLAMFRELVGAAKAGPASKLGDHVAKYIEEDFVSQRKTGASAETLIHQITVARLVAASLHQEEVTTGVWDRVKTLETERKKRLENLGEKQI